MGSTYVCTSSGSADPSHHHSVYPRGWVNTVSDLSSSGRCSAAYMSSPCHIELILSEKEAPVKKEVRATTTLQSWCGCDGVEKSGRK